MTQEMKTIEELLQYLDGVLKTKERKTSELGTSLTSTGLGAADQILDFYAFEILKENRDYDPATGKVKLFAELPGGTYTTRKLVHLRKECGPWVDSAIFDAAQSAISGEDAAVFVPLADTMLYQIGEKIKDQREGLTSLRAAKGEKVSSWEDRHHYFGAIYSEKLSLFSISDVPEGILNMKPESNWCIGLAWSIAELARGATKDSFGQPLDGLATVLGKAGLTPHGLCAALPLGNYAYDRDSTVGAEMLRCYNRTIKVEALIKPICELMQKENRVGDQK